MLLVISKVLSLDVYIMEFREWGVAVVLFFVPAAASIGLGILMLVDRPEAWPLSLMAIGWPVLLGWWFHAMNRRDKRKPEK